VGYFIRTEEVKFFLPVSTFDEAYKRMCDLNQRDDLKSGGRHGGENDANSPRPKGMNYHPSKWFSWMQPNYPEMLKTTPEILTSLGFDLDFADDGSIAYLSYDNKIGQESLFLESLVGLIEEGSYIVWRGEDGEMWKEIFHKDKVETLSARVVFE
jgi:hypothetical protein